MGVKKKKALVGGQSPKGSIWERKEGEGQG